MMMSNTLPNECQGSVYYFYSVAVLYKVFVSLIYTEKGEKQNSVDEKKHEAKPKQVCVYE